MSPIRFACRCLTSPRLVERLSGLTEEQTAALPGLDPARAPVILAGAVIAEGSATAVGAAAVTRLRV